MEDLLAGSPTTTPFKPSVLVDAEKGKPLELEVIVGTSLRYTRELQTEEHWASRPLCHTQASDRQISSWVGDHQRIPAVDQESCDPEKDGTDGPENGFVCVATFEDGAVLGSDGGVEAYAADCDDDPDEREDGG
ncbi:hypothetical protein BDZ45DRAFT_730633 [Acephala macrosclerotiorum]|nr:hypothetical protein BDZ45DRAFT_730633 [Acephala macrosclerotiorum]